MMKKISMGITILMFMVSTAFAAPFTPEVMKISASPQIHYAFDGSILEIPVTLGGVGGTTTLLVFTKGKGSTISNVTNGFMGWHHVNKIDTCVYLSDFSQLSKGTSTITWNGKDDDGGIVPAGDYTYYIWACDNVTPRTQVTKFLRFDPWSSRTILTQDTAGNKLANPIIYTANEQGNAGTDPIVCTKHKWVIGSDPSDVSFEETCTAMQVMEHGGMVFDPTNHSKFWSCYQANNGSFIVKKSTWVPNGMATQDTDDLTWGTDGMISYSATHAPNSQWGPGLATDGVNYLFATDADAYAANTTASNLIYIDISDGTLVKQLDLSKWWVDVNDGLAGAQTTGGPSEFHFRNGFMALGSHSTCINQVINPAAEDKDDAVLWTNGNGDTIGDHNNEPSAEKPWVCNDYNVGPYKYNITMDDNLFTMFPSYGVGAVSFGLYAPDGTGIDYVALAGETAAQKFGVEVIDYGSVYDGIYTTTNLGMTGSDVDNTIWYVAHDSIKGVITDKEVGVADASPSAFTVAQNSPNPFNPTTTISFTLAKAGKTTVEVYNVAGQKVSTLVNGSMSAGSHSVSWNAAKFSAGVYFYTVKSGTFSRTMKMTLLK